MLLFFLYLYFFLRVWVEMFFNEALSYNWKFPIAERLAVPQPQNWQRLSCTERNWHGNVGKVRRRRMKPYFFPSYNCPSFFLKRCHQRQIPQGFMGFSVDVNLSNSTEFGQRVWFHKFTLTVKFIATYKVLNSASHIWPQLIRCDPRLKTFYVLLLSYLRPPCLWLGGSKTWFYPFPEMLTLLKTRSS